MKLLGIAAFSIFSLTSGFSNAQNLISNGSFENGTLISNYGDPGVMLVTSGSGAIPDWTVIAPPGRFVAVIGEGNPSFPAAYGKQFLDMTGITYNPIGQGVMQTINTVAGMSYILGFDIGNSTLPDYGATSSLLVSAGGNAQVFTHAGNDGINSWQHFSMNFVATSATTDISLLTNGGAHYIGLDNVSVMAAVPEPETYGMLLGGLGLIGFVQARRRARKAGR